MNPQAIATLRQARSSGSPQIRQQTRRLVRIVAIVLAFAVLAAYRFRLTFAAFRNSDDASNFLAGVEMAEGNWRLHGWMMAPDNYYPTEVLAQAILKLLFGYHTIFMQGLEALVWAGIAMLGVGLATLGARARHLPGIVSIALALLAFNVFEHDFRDVFLSSVASHSFTILLALLVFRLIAGRNGPETNIRIATLGLVLTIGSIADPIFNVIACLPVLAVSLLEAGARGPYRALLGRVGVTVGAMVLAHVLVSINDHNGGFRSVRLSITLASFPQVADHLLFAVGSTARLLGAEFFGRTIDHPGLGGPTIYLLRAPMLLGFVIVCWEIGRVVLRRVREWPNAGPDQPGERLELLLWTSLVLCIASTAMTSVITDASCARFFLPSTVMGSILVARRFGRYPLTALYGAGVMLASILVSILVLPAGSSRTTITIPQERQIIAALREHDLHHGYSGYWESTITTALSDRGITSLALVGAGDHRLHTLDWFCNLDWFRSAAHDWHGRIFVIAAKRPGGLELSQGMVTEQFGPPREIIDLDQFMIDVYDITGSELRSLVPETTGRH